MMKYTKEILQEATDNSKSVMGVLRFLGLREAGGNHSHIKKKLIKFNIDISHFNGTNHRFGIHSSQRKTAEQILIIKSHNRREHAHLLRRALIEIGVPYSCVECGISDTYNQKPIRLEVEHLNKNYSDCQKNNLVFMCPNCHSQAPTSGKKLVGLTSCKEYSRLRRKKN